MIVQELHRIQHTHRYLPDAELRKLAERTGTPLYRLQEVASFFPHFKLSPPPAVEVHICHDMACHQRGCMKMKQDLQSLLASECSAGTVAVEYASCLGRCDRPVAARAIARYWGIWHDWAKAALMRALGACQRVVVMEDWPCLLRSRVSRFILQVCLIREPERSPIRS